MVGEVVVGGAAESRYEVRAAVACCQTRTIQVVNLADVSEIQTCTDKQLLGIVLCSSFIHSSSLSSTQLRYSSYKV